MLVCVSVNSHFLCFLCVFKLKFQLCTDMCLDNETVSTEQRPAQMEFLPNSSHDISAFRQRAMTIGKHLCLELNADGKISYYIYKLKLLHCMIRYIV